MTQRDVPQFSVLIMICFLAPLGCAHSSGGYKNCQDKSWAPDKVTTYTVDTTAISIPPPPDFVPVEQTPIILDKPNPSYPEGILSAIHEKYRIWVLVWVGNNGSVRQLRVRKCEPQQLIPFVIDAATQMRFTPARVKGDSVDAWVSIPFQYPE